MKVLLSEYYDVKYTRNDNSSANNGNTINTKKLSPNTNKNNTSTLTSIPVDTSKSHPNPNNEIRKLTASDNNSTNAKKRKLPAFLTSNGTTTINNNNTDDNVKNHQGNTSIPDNVSYLPALPTLQLN